MLELRQLHYFIVVAEERHFTRAAIRLRIAQPPVRQQIRALERQVGQSLFDRRPRAVHLTPAGEALVPHARAALHATEAGLSEMAALSGTLRGTLTVGVVEAAEALQVPRLLARFHRRYPHSTVAVRQQGSEELLDLVRQGAMDLAFTGLHKGRATPGVRTRWLLPMEPLVLAVAPGHRLSGRRRVRFADLTEEPLITLREGTGLRVLLERTFADAGASPRIVCDTSDLATAIALTVEGMGSCILPASAAASAGTTLVTMSLTEPSLHRNLALIWRAPDAASPLARAFLRLGPEESVGAEHTEGS